MVTTNRTSIILLLLLAEPQGSSTTCRNLSPTALCIEYRHRCSEPLVYKRCEKTCGCPPTGLFTPSNASTAKPDFSRCDFESGTMCGWSQSTADDFDWEFYDKSNKNTSTESLSDHTTVSNNGKFIYAESSSSGGGKRAQLITTKFPAGRACLQFYYLMASAGGGTLNVYTQIEGEPIHTRWSKSGKVGSDWDLGLLQIHTTSSYKIIFEATMAGKKNDFVGLDDIQILQGDESRCPRINTCSFERGLCTFKNSKLKNGFDWTLRSGSDPSSVTGPHTDHTLVSTRGHYMLAVGSQRGAEAKPARLMGYNSSPNGLVSCIQFFYHMHGGVIGALRVIIKTNEKEEVLWQQEGEQGDVWHYGSVAIPPLTVNFQVIFEASGGSSAVDDIRQSDGNCAIQPHGALPPPAYKDPVGY